MQILKFKFIKIFVRSGVRTHALIRGPEISHPPSIGRQGLVLESGALDHSAILTVNNNLS